MSTDHKAEAVKFLAATQEQFWDAEQLPEINTRLASAQVHATLALVEEIRTATLAATVQRDLAAGFGIPTERLEDLDRRLS